jgi:hypothetical protein
MVKGQMDLYDKAEDLGIEEQRIWDATLDTRTRTSHGKLDGKPSDGKDEGGHWWFTDVGKVYGPMQSGRASFDINCRCRVRSQIEGYKPKVRRIRGQQGPQPYQTFDEWARPQGWTPEKGWPKKKPIKGKVQKPLKTPRRLKPFETRAEASDWMVKNVPGMEKANFENLDMREINAITRAFDDEIQFNRKSFDLDRFAPGIGDSDVVMDYLSTVKLMRFNAKGIHGVKPVSRTIDDILKQTQKALDEQMMILEIDPTNAFALRVTKEHKKTIAIFKNKKKYGITKAADFSYGFGANKYDSIKIATQHEIGHHRYDFLTSDAKERLVDMFTDLKNKGAFPTSYSGKNLQEFFAESYTIIRNNLGKIPIYNDEITKIIEGL